MKTAFSCFYLGNFDFSKNRINSSIFKSSMMINSRTNDICVQFFFSLSLSFHASLGMLLNMLHLLVYPNNIYRFKIVYLFFKKCWHNISL